ncbi:MAG: monovalent cation/H+ antiporter subunit D family protein [Methanophagales archaeon]|nr:monovalent cation/H+ antiporter subunit D family protein [Methanophagales archaeon]
MLSPVEQFPVLIIAISLLSAFTILVAGLVNKKSCCFISIATILLQFVMSIVILDHVLTVGTIHYWLGGWKPPWGIEYLVDALNAYVLVIVLFIALICAIYSKRSIEHELPHKLVSFYTVFQLLITGMCGVTVTGDIFNMYVFLEIMCIAGYALIASSKIGLKAGFTYLVMGSIGACFVLLGIGFLYSVTGSLNMHDLSLLLPPLYGNRVVQAAFVFFFTGLGIKMAFFPLHTWQPDAYAYAPSAVSVIIAAAMSKVSIYAFIRVLFSVYTVEFIQIYAPLTTVISWLAAIAIIFGSVYALAQYNLKRMFAYSSVAHVGYIMLAVGICTSTTLGLTPAVMHLLNHAVMKGCLFLIAGAFIYKKAELWDIMKFPGLGRKMPYTGIAFIFTALAMCDIPPSAGFVTILYLILAFLEAGQFIFAAVILFSVIVTFCYFFHVVEMMYLRVGVEEEIEKERGEIPMSMLIPVLVLAALSWIVGVIWLMKIPFPILDAVNSMFGLGVVP